MDRGEFLRRAGVGVAASALPFAAPADALAAERTGDFAPHPAWRFVFVCRNTTDPLFIATQFGAQDASALLGCSYQWAGSASGDAKQAARVLREAAVGGADGIAVSVTDSDSFKEGLGAAAKAGIPVVVFNMDETPSSTARHLGYVGPDHRAAGRRAAADLLRLAGGGPVALLAPRLTSPWVEARLQGALATIPRASRVTVRVGVETGKQLEVVEQALAQRRYRGALALDGTLTVALGGMARRLRLHGAGFDLLPADLGLISSGDLAFVVDQQPYLQGFMPVLQLFMAKISEGLVSPVSAETSVIVRKANVARFIGTKSRFEGSSSRHRYPLDRA